MAVEFPEGLFVKDAEPEFVLAKLSFNVEEFTEWAQRNANPSGYVNVDICRSKGGKLYGKRNDWTPEEKEKAPAKKKSQEVKDDLPF